MGLLDQLRSLALESEHALTVMAALAGNLDHLGCCRYPGDLLDPYRFAFMHDQAVEMIGWGS